MSFKTNITIRNDQIGSYGIGEYQETTLLKPGVPIWVVKEDLTQYILKINTDGSLLIKPLVGAKPVISVNDNELSINFNKNGG